MRIKRAVSRMIADARDKPLCADCGRKRGHPTPYPGLFLCDRCSLARILLHEGGLKELIRIRKKNGYTTDSLLVKSE
jgi:ribosomal protein L37AE/L43A